MSQQQDKEPDIFAELIFIIIALGTIVFCTVAALAVVY